MTTEDEALYGLLTSALRVKATHVIGLKDRIVKAAPADLDPAGRNRLAKIVATAQVVGVEITRREESTSPALALRRNEVVARAGALRDVLVATSVIASEVNDRGERARRLLDKVFPIGVTFARVDSLAVYGETKRMLDRIAQSALRPELDLVIGSGMVEMLERAHAALADAMGIGAGERPSEVRRTDLRDAVRTFRRAVLAYVRHLAATVDDEDPATLARFGAATAPIDAYRTEHGGAGRRASDEDDTDVIEPAPPPTP